MPWPDFSLPPVPAVCAPNLLRPLAGDGASGAAFAIATDPLDGGSQSDPGSAGGWHRIERTGGWHELLGGPILLRPNDMVFIQRGSVIRLTIGMSAGQPARDVWLAVGWQLSNSATGAVYTLGRPAFDDSAWRARRSGFFNNVNTLGGDFWLDTTGSGTGAAYDTWADPELGDGCSIKLGSMTGAQSAQFDRIRLWMRGGCYNAAVGPTLKDLYYPTSGKPTPGTRIFILPAVAALRNTQCE